MSLFFYSLSIGLTEIMFLENKMLSDRHKRTLSTSTGILISSAGNTVCSKSFTDMYTH